MSRTGKIARLLDELRRELNERLQDGEAGTELLEWLNGLPAVKRVLKQQFAGVPISAQNLSDWRQGGYEEWRETEELTEMIRRVRTQATDLECATPVSEGVAAVLSAELARMTVLGLKQAPDAETEARWERMERLLKQVDRLRRGDQRASWARIREQEWHLKLRVHVEKQREKEDQWAFNRKWVLPAMERIEAQQRREAKAQEAMEAELQRQAQDAAAQKAQAGPDQGAE